MIRRREQRRAGALPERPSPRTALRVAAAVARPVLAVGLALAVASGATMGCAPLIEPAPREGVSAGPEVTAGGGVAAATPTTSPAAGPAPAVLEKPPPRAAAGGGWDAMVLTLGKDARQAPAVDGRYVVWQGRDARAADPARHDDEIHLYDLRTGEVRMLTDDDAHDILPRIDGGWVVWLRYTEGGGPMELLAHSLRDGVTKVLAEDVAPPMGSRLGGDAAFVLAGGAVVWTAGVWPDTEIHYFHLASGRETVVSDGHGRNRSPDTDGAHVVWLSQTAEGEAVMLSVPFAGRSWVLADATPGRETPQVDGGLVVWSDWDGSDTEILLAAVPVDGGDGETVSAPVRLTDNSVEDRAPSVDRGLVVWSEVTTEAPVTAPPSGPPPGEARILLYEHAIGKSRVLATGVAPDVSPDVRSGLAWWKAPAGGEGGFVLYDSAAEQTVALGRKVAGAGPAVSAEGDRIVWSGWQGEAPQVFLGYRGVRPVGPPPAGLKVRFGDTGGSPYAPAIETLADALAAAGSGGAPPAAGGAPGDDPPSFGGGGGAGTGAGSRPAGTAAPAFRPADPVTRGKAVGFIEAVVGPVPAAGDPAGLVTRGQFVSLTVRALRSGRPGVLPLLRVGFSGTVVYHDPDHGDDLLVAEQGGLLGGLVGFGPEWDVWTPITRGEAAQVLANARGLPAQPPAGGGGADAPAPGPAGGATEHGGLLASPALSPEETSRLVRDMAVWRSRPEECRGPVVEVVPARSGPQTLAVVFEVVRLGGEDAAVDEFLGGGVASVVHAASVLNAGRGAQIGWVRVVLRGTDGRDLVTSESDLHRRGTSIRWDPSVMEAVRRHLPPGPGSAAD